MGAAGSILLGNLDEIRVIGHDIARAIKPAKPAHGGETTALPDRKRAAAVRELEQYPAGRYTVVRTPTAVTQHYSPGSQLLARLERGQSAEVAEASASSNGRIRCRLTSPLDGWVTAAYPARGWRWIECVSAEADDAAADDPGDPDPAADRAYRRPLISSIARRLRAQGWGRKTAH